MSNNETSPLLSVTKNWIIYWIISYICKWVFALHSGSGRVLYTVACIFHALQHTVVPCLDERALHLIEQNFLCSLPGNAKLISYLTFYFRGGGGLLLIVNPVSTVNPSLDHNVGRIDIKKPGKAKSLSWQIIWGMQSVISIRHHSRFNMKKFYHFDVSVNQLTLWFACLYISHFIAIFKLILTWELGLNSF